MSLFRPRGWDLCPSSLTVATLVARVGGLLTLYAALGFLISHRVEQRRVGSVRAACLLFQATETARSLPTDVSDTARKVSVRFVAEAEAGRRALSDANVECRP